VNGSFLLVVFSVRLMFMVAVVVVEEVVQGAVRLFVLNSGFVMNGMSVIMSLILLKIIVLH
jgi:hypothetical protein